VLTENNIKLDLKLIDEVLDWTDLAWLLSSGNLCEDGNKTFGSIKDEEFLRDQLCSME
jgi:hypothetical protein